YLLTNKNFLKTMGNTGVYTLWTVVIILLIAIVLAVWLSRRQDKMTKFTQAAAFTPHIISMVSIAMVFSQMMNPNIGLFNTVLEGIGLPKLNWLQSSDTAMGSVIFVACWKSIGYYSLIIIGALQSISPSIYEAAELDNTGRWRTLTRITIPMISPQLFFTLIVMTIGSFKVFDTVRLLTDGGPNNATSTLVYYIYKTVFWDDNVGRACAASVILLICVSILTVIYFKLLSKKVHYQ
ncbi:MAG TPA: sugar ABC transporter permease, partial [Candidatus Faecivicinus avistercoris]|nr:sugar ABC transporter permease [Candidatus Faecivicinus avistercoris]